MENPLKVLFFFGTRPEAIKLAPIIRLAKQSKLLEPIVCASGQHAELLAQALEAFEIVPDHNLEVMVPNQTLLGLTGRMLLKTEKILKAETPDIVVVQGDATSALVGALAAFAHHIPIAHVEAGLRTYESVPFPEEMNRYIIDHISSILFAPTLYNEENLIDEGIDPRNIKVTGNTGVDALNCIIASQIYDSPHERYALLTVHRRESFGQPIKDIIEAVKRLSGEILIRWVVHPNPNIHDIVYQALEGKMNIELIPPQPYPNFIGMLKNAYIVLTDSGGVQEDAAKLHVPAILLRDVTERPENVGTGAILTGTCPRRIFDTTMRLMKADKHYKRASAAKNPFGDGRASERIIQYLEKLAARVMI